MTRLIITVIIGFIVISPLIALTLNKSEDKWKCLILFVSYYLLYTCFLFLPNFIPALRIIESSWNWSGKAYAIVGSLLFYGVFRKAFGCHNYITFKQNNHIVKRLLLLAVIIFVVTICLAFFSNGNSTERVEYFLFQFTMPGLDEELAFRGIMLGLLSNALRPKVKLGSVQLGNPAVWITSILFGLVHSFGIDHNWNFHQNWFEFLNAFTIGLLLGWMTIKSGSIVMAIFAHNLFNTLPKLLFWL